jgi:hypothetical protein
VSLTLLSRASHLSPSPPRSPPTISRTSVLAVQATPHGQAMPARPAIPRRQVSPSLPAIPRRRAIPSLPAIPRRRAIPSLPAIPRRRAIRALRARRSRRATKGRRNITDRRAIRSRLVPRRRSQATVFRRPYGDQIRLTRRIRSERARRAIATIGRGWITVSLPMSCRCHVVGMASTRPGHPRERSRHRAPSTSGSHSSNGGSRGPMTRHQLTRHQPTRHQPTRHQPTGHKPTGHQPTRYLLHSLLTASSLGTVRRRWAPASSTRSSSTASFHRTESSPARKVSRAHWVSSGARISFALRTSRWHRTRAGSTPTEAISPLRRSRRSRRSPRCLTPGRPARARSIPRSSTTSRSSTGPASPILVRLGQVNQDPVNLD